LGHLTGIFFEQFNRHANCGVACCLTYLRRQLGFGE
jgi:hypothetical protein